MVLRYMVRYLGYFSLLGIAGLCIAGCVVHDPPALGEIAKARKSLDNAEKAGEAGRSSGKFAALEQRYLQARGVFYSCNDAEATRLAQAIVADLSGRAALAPAPMPASNRSPVCRLTAPARVQVGEAVSFDASASSDPDGDALTYTWEIGDGAPLARLTALRTTHAYARAGNYTAKVMVDDSRGGSCSATVPVTVVLKVVLQEQNGKVLFDFDKSALKPEARRQLGVVLQALKEQPTLQTHIVGHTDSDGSDVYNVKLSERRAESVAHYLGSQGMGTPSITSAWRGEREPVTSNATAGGRTQNRRVEITLSPPTPWRTFRLGSPAVSA